MKCLVSIMKDSYYAVMSLRLVKKLKKGGRRDGGSFCVIKFSYFKKPILTSNTSHKNPRHHPWYKIPFQPQISSPTQPKIPSKLKIQKRILTYKILTKYQRNF
ncbi:unnamed protein product [Moneuplotes crassus]|uniref:Uncharacterized protein n=1 Tax=Euplotes crassus TaxID=5936 RepID=A0AAD1XDB9_EUPCR|nr:unnamed protein product [Moneuplotes crassus]